MINIDLTIILLFQMTLVLLSHQGASTREGVGHRLNSNQPPSKALPAILLTQTC